MTDKVSVEQRSANMRAVRNRNTKPELCVRQITHALGYRYRLHSSRLPGKPDLVFAGRRKVIFVHGCFWHRHEGCKRATMPQTHADFWRQKLERNAARDALNLARLHDQGWSVLTIWECETRDVDALRAKLSAFLGAQNAS